MSRRAGLSCRLWETLARVRASRWLKAQQPYAIALADRRLMALAGLWETWRSPAGERVRSFAIITTTPNELCAEIHNRMPVILTPESWPVWLGEEPCGRTSLKGTARAIPVGGDDALAGEPAGRNVKNNDPTLIEPITATAE
jgi:putative SOS response-associated peptidase YedK